MLDDITIVHLNDLIIRKSKTMKESFFKKEKEKYVGETHDIVNMFVLLYKFTRKYSEEQLEDIPDFEKLFYRGFDHKWHEHFEISESINVSKRYPGITKLIGEYGSKSNLSGYRKMLEFHKSKLRLGNRSYSFEELKQIAALGW